MGGESSDSFRFYRTLIYLGFLAIRKYHEPILTLVKLSIRKDENVLIDLKNRFKLDLNEIEFVEYVQSLIDESNNNFYTKQYDNYQNLTNGIL
jgi:phosphatidylinositol 4-kinase B